MFRRVRKKKHVVVDVPVDVNGLPRRQRRRGRARSRRISSPSASSRERRARFDERRVARDARDARARRRARRKSRPTADGAERRVYVIGPVAQVPKTPRRREFATDIVAARVPSRATRAIRRTPRRERRERRARAASRAQKVARDRERRDVSTARAGHVVRGESRIEGERAHYERRHLDAIERVRVARRAASVKVRGGHRLWSVVCVREVVGRAVVRDGCVCFQD